MEAARRRWLRGRLPPACCHPKSPSSFPRGIRPIPSGTSWSRNWISPPSSTPTRKTKAWPKLKPNSSWPAWLTTCASWPGPPPEAEIRWNLGCGANQAPIQSPSRGWNRGPESMSTSLPSMPVRASELTSTTGRWVGTRMIPTHLWQQFGRGEISRKRGIDLLGFSPARSRPGSKGSPLQHSGREAAGPPWPLNESHWIVGAEPTLRWI